MIICVNDLFTTEQHQVFQQYNIITPKEGVTYTIRDVFRTQRGLAVLLEEIKNPMIPMIIGENPEDTLNAEPNWGIWRFGDLQNRPLNEDEVLENFKKRKRETNISTTE